MIMKNVVYCGFHRLCNTSTCLHANVLLPHLKVEELSSLENLTEENGDGMIRNGERGKRGVSQLLFLYIFIFCTWCISSCFLNHTFHVLPFNIDLRHFVLCFVCVLIYLLLKLYVDSFQILIFYQIRVSAIITMEMVPSTMWTSQDAGFSNYPIR